MTSPAAPDAGSRRNLSPNWTPLHAQQGRRQRTPRADQGNRHHPADLHGIGPSGAARLLGDVGDITRFADRGRLRLLERHRTDRRLLR